MKTVVELINPSDAVTFLMDDVKVAGAATMLLGCGAFGLKDKDGKCHVPIMLFRGADGWLEENGIKDLRAFIDANNIAIAEFLETVHYGSFQDREAFKLAISKMTLEKAAEYRAEVNDKRRSSLNNIGGVALKLAQQMRQIAAKQKP